MTEPSKTGITRRFFMQGSGLALGMASVGRFFSTRLPEQLARWGIPTPWYETGTIRSTFTVCDMCPWRCGIIVHTVDGRVHKIEGNPADPKSRGRLCARGQGGVSFLNDPDRLMHPLIRTGERGSGEFREASWEEALDYVADRMLTIRDEVGPESVAFFGHTSGDGWFVDHMAQAWGSPNAARPSSSLCTSPREEAALLTVGRVIGGHEPVDWEHIEAFALIGSHIGEDTRNTVMQDFSAAKARGAKVIVVDPRFSTAASKADYWLPIRPGTDTALLLAWMHVLIDENLFDSDYLETWASGFRTLQSHVAEFSPEWAAPITDLSADLIGTTARVLGTALPKAAIVPGRHVTWYGNDTQRMRAVYLVNSLLGSWGREGGLYFPKSPYIEAYPHPPYAVAGSSGGCSAEPGEEETDLPLGPSGKARADGVRDSFLRGPTAIQELIEPMITGDPYPIKGLIAFGVNLLHSLPNQERTKEALQALDLVVAIDVLPQDHVAWADVVLPESTYLERADDLWTVAHKTPYIAIRDAAIEPMGNTRPGWWIAHELGVRLELDAYFGWDGIDEWNETRLRSIGQDLEKVRAMGGVVLQEGKPYLDNYEGGAPFPTASGTIELVSGTLGAAGFDELPVYEAPDPPPEGFYRLLYGRHPAHTFAKTQNTPMLSGLFAENELWLADDEAELLGVRSGDRVMLTNQSGATSGPIKVKATQAIRRDAVYMVHGYGHDSKGLTRAVGRGASDAALQTDYALDPVCGGAGLRTNFVRLERVS